MGQASKSRFDMKEVKVRYFALLRELLDDTKEEEYKVEDGTMLMDLLLNHVPERHPKVARRWKESLFKTEGGEVMLDAEGFPSLRGHYLILINGRSYVGVSEEGGRPGLRYKLKEGDEIALLPPVGGG